jgi:ADP-ribosyl-[dinitrogen reductase] hydrolase
MRLAPVPIYYFPDRELVLRYSVESSRTTHAAPECLEACRLLGDVLFRALSGRPKRQVLLGSDPAEYEEAAIRRLASGGYMDSTESDIRGTGYVVQSLEAALWCFWKTDSFEQAILKAANLGEDADTTAAVCGQVAGAFYSESGIPSVWLDVLHMRQEIKDLVSRLRRAAGGLEE